jgi:hypothetical protein
MEHLYVPFTTLISGNLQDVVDSVCVQDVFQPFHSLFAYYSPYGRRTVIIDEAATRGADLLQLQSVVAWSTHAGREVVRTLQTNA